MPLDLLSSIKGARSSEAIDELFNVIKKAVPENQAMESSIMPNNFASISELRSDEVSNCDEGQKEVIRSNFPGEKNGYLLVPKVIEE